MLSSDLVHCLGRGGVKCGVGVEGGFEWGRGLGHGHGKGGEEGVGAGVKEGWVEPSRELRG